MKILTLLLAMFYVISLSSASIAATKATPTKAGLVKASGVKASAMHFKVRR